MKFMRKADSEWSDSKRLAKAVLSDRVARRKVMSTMLGTALFLMIGGVWVIDGWLSQNPWVFLLWWGSCAFLVLMLLLFAVYDALAVVREEREKSR